MPRRRPFDCFSGSVRAAVGLMLACLLISGCGMLGDGSGAGGSETPEGFARASTKYVSFAYPAGWNKLPDGAYPDGWPVAFGKKGDSAGEVAAFTKLPNTSEAQLAAEAVLTKLQLTHNFERKRARAIEISNAQSAWRIDYSYNAGSESGPPAQKVLGTDVTVIDEGGHAVLIRITRFPDAVSTDTVQQIVDSIAAEPVE